MDFSYIFTNGWFERVGKDYSYLVGLAVLALKTVAIMHPGTPSNKIIDLVQGLLFKKKDQA